jgi:cardiolipin synthase
MPRFLARTTLWIAIAATIAFTIVAVLVGVNLSSGEKRIQQAVQGGYAVDDPRFLHVVGVLLGPPVVGGNRYRVLRNGDEIFPAMLDAIAGAKRSISFETYIYWSGEIGRRFADALAERARAGVPVHVLLDWVGSSKMDDALLEEMRRSGVQVLKYHPPHWAHLGRLNNRTHRKLLVVDGRIGFTGGVGIAEKWTGHAQDPDHWRDTHVRIEGPAVAQMQAVFLDNWIKSTGQVLVGDAYFPTLPPVGDGLAQVFSSSPTGGSESMELMMLLAITAAQRTIRISNSYFVPNELALKALADARARGVKVQIIVPGPWIDTETVRSASRATWGRLLDAGAEIYEYQPTMFHCKVLVVDDYLVSIGSTNFDNRSFRLNDEANLNIYDTDFARQQSAIFEADRARTKRITRAEWESRPWTERVQEQAAALLDGQL